VGIADDESVESTEEDALTGVGRGDIDVHVIVVKCNLEGQITTIGSVSYTVYRMCTD